MRTPKYRDNSAFTEMSIPFAGVFTRSAGIYSAIGVQLKKVNLKPIKKITFQFDPFQNNVKTLRDCMFIFSSEKIGNTNPRCTFRTDVLDNVEPIITVTLEEGRELQIKTENLNSLEVLQQFNSIILPLVPKEEEVTGKIAGKLAGKGAAKKPAAGKAQKKK